MKTSRVAYGYGAGGSNSCWGIGPFRVMCAVRVSFRVFFFEKRAAVHSPLGHA
jgi:hypothetical protein